MNVLFRPKPSICPSCTRHLRDAIPRRPNQALPLRRLLRPAQYRTNSESASPEGLNESDAPSRPLDQPPGRVSGTKRKRRGPLATPIKSRFLGEESDVLVLHHATAQPTVGDVHNAEEPTPGAVDEGRRLNLLELEQLIQEPDGSTSPDDVLEQIDKLRPQQGEAYDPMSRSEFERLYGVLTDGFTGKQLQTYVERHGIHKILNRARAGMINKTLSNGLRWKYTPWASGSSEAKNAKTASKKAMLSETILRQVWKVELEDEIFASGHAEISLPGWQLELLLGDAFHGLFPALQKQRGVAIHITKNPMTNRDSTIHISGNQSPVNSTLEDIESALGKLVQGDLDLTSFEQGGLSFHSDTTSFIKGACGVIVVPKTGTGSFKTHLDVFESRVMTTASTENPSASSEPSMVSLISTKTAVAEAFRGFGLLAQYLSTQKTSRLLPIGEDRKPSDRETSANMVDIPPMSGRQLWVNGLAEDSIFRRLASSLPRRTATGRKTGPLLSTEDLCKTHAEQVQPQIKDIEESLRNALALKSAEVTSSLDQSVWNPQATLEVFSRPGLVAFGQNKGRRPSEAPHHLFTPWIPGLNRFLGVLSTGLLEDKFRTTSLTVFRFAPSPWQVPLELQGRTFGLIFSDRPRKNGRHFFGANVIMEEERVALRIPPAASDVEWTIRKRHNMISLTSALQKTVDRIEQSFIIGGNPTTLCNELSSPISLPGLPLASRATLPAKGRRSHEDAQDVQYWLLDIQTEHTTSLSFGGIPMSFRSVEGDKFREDQYELRLHLETGSPKTAETQASGHASGQETDTPRLELTDAERISTFTSNSLALCKILTTAVKSAIDGSSSR